jgi:hypothetical protein
MGLASLVVGALAVLSLLVSAGGLDVPAAARAVPEAVQPGPGQPTEPNEGPVESLPPGAVPSGPLGEEPGASVGEGPVGSAPGASEGVSFEPVDSGGPDGASGSPAP